MKSTLRLLALLLSFFILHPSSLPAQGPLTPPGAPAPLFKTLTQVEPRTPISALPFTITNSGSYYLTTNLTGTASQHGITIATGLNDVTVDLNGFTLVGLSNSGNGLTAFGSTNIAVVNGTVRNWTNGLGMVTVDSCRFEGLRILGNRAIGLAAGNSCVVQNCIVTTNGTTGISAGNLCRISDCLVRFNGADGIAVDVRSVVERCLVASNGGVGIKTSSSCTVTRCDLHLNALDGIRVANRCAVTDNRVEGPSGGLGTNACIRTVSDSTRIEGNHVLNHQLGIRVENGGNIIVRNTANVNGTNYFIAPNNSVGPTNNSASTLTGTHPFSNWDL